MNKEEREMITEREEFIKICGILAYSDTHPTDCHYITSFIVGLGKEIEDLHNKIDKAIEYIENDLSHVPVVGKRNRSYLLEILNGDE